MSDSYRFWLTVHILAAVIWVGGGIAMHILARRTLKRGDPDEIYKFSVELNHIGLRLYAPTSLVLLIAGFFLVDKAGYDLSETFVTLGLVGWFVSFALGIGYYGPQDKKLQKLVAANGPNDPGVITNVKQALMVSSFELLILVLVTIDMSWKPFL